MKCLRMVPLLFLLSFNAIGQEAEKAEVQQYKLSFGFDYSQLRFKNSGDITKKTGTMVGGYGEYVFRRQNYLFRLEGDAVLGDFGYSSSFSGQLDDVRNLLFETRLTFGWRFGQSEKAHLVPYSGLGFRYLSEDTGGEISSLGFMTSDRRSNYLYSPFGVQWVLPLGSGWSVIPSGEYDLFWRGWQFTRLNDLDKSLPIIRNTQTGGYGARGSVKIARNYGPVDFFVEPYFRYWKIDDSDPAQIEVESIPLTVVEPAHDSKEGGIRIGVRIY